MITVKKIVFAGLAATILGCGDAAAAPRLWYKTAADDWMKAMPLGNGRLGAMVYGGEICERVA
ncbi:MAG: glycoside hydrolase family 95 protein, partial [Muribaculaceae bacterium]|nr:glycoside hydrolase family 95 protein [Muribaculaceae bacterium]